MQIYLDYSATTPTRPEAIAAMQAVLTQHWGNPSSLHEWGQRAATVLEQARMMADYINKVVQKYQSPLGEGWRYQRRND